MTPLQTRIEKIDNESTFAYVPALEPLWGVLCLLINDEKTVVPCREIYGEDNLLLWRKKYRFLFECYDAVRELAPVSMLDFLLDLPMEQLTPESYRDHLLSIPAEDFLWRQLELDYVDGVDKTLLAHALTDDAALDQIFRAAAGDRGSFLAFSAFVRQSGRFITEFFSLAEELNSPALWDVIDRQAEKIARTAQAVRDGVAGAGPFEFSQQMMGKTFRNRGPYESFAFLPSYLLPCHCIRFFHTKGEHKRQLLFLSLRDSARKQEDTVRTLKAAADGTRYQILTLLAKEGPLRGLDIAKKVSLAASTVSHHMEQLKDAGLITEEQVKNAKYYGINKITAAAFLDELKNDLLP